MGESSAIKYHVYGFDIFHIIRVSNRNEKRRHFYNDWPTPKKVAFDNAISRLLSYYGVSDRFDLYPYLIKDIVKKHSIPWEYIELNFSREQVIRAKERKVILKQIEHEMIMNHEIPLLWKSEQEMFRIIKKEYADAIFHYTAKWISPQHIDVFIPSINCAFEFQGQQHFVNIEHFGGKKKLKQRIALDERKLNLCKSKAIHLIEWHFSEPLTKLVLMNKLAGLT
jgi:hypothetical protein